jgi:TetR/AcrR family transcriptional regulator
MTETASRMRSEDRRELVLHAAMGVFGDRGYVGATTDAVARAAGVSQPYVVRMFGTKEALFLAVLERALDRLMATFGAVFDADAAGTTPDDRPLAARLGDAYVDLLADRGLLLSLMQAFVLGADPAIGPAARAGFLRVYRELRERGGFDAEQTREFLAGGMLLNTLVGLRMVDEYDADPDAAALVEVCLPTKSDALAQLREAAS